MKTKIFTLIIVIVTSVGTIYAERVQIGDLYYDLNTNLKTAEVTYRNLSYNSVGLAMYNEGWDINSANIPSTITHNNITYEIKRIGRHAFSSCSSLTSVTIPNSVTSIGEYAFSGCSGLTSMNIPNSVIGIANNAFERCSGLSSVSLSNNITKIADRLFYGCESLTSVIIPEGVNTIGSYAFVGCKLTNITIPKTLSKIGDASNPSFPLNRIITINFSGNLEDWCSKTWSPRNVCEGYPLLINGVLQQNIIIPDNITNIAVAAFSSCGSLNSVTIPGTVTSIGAYAFYDCQELNAVTICDGVTTIGEAAFWGCSFFSLTIPNSVMDVNRNAFRSCRVLRTVQLSSNMHIVAEGAFMNCRNLTSITIPEGIKSICESAFEGCYGLTLVKLGTEVEFIDMYSFKGCRSLKSIVLPNSIKKVWNPFEECSSLEEIVLLAETPPALVDILGIDSIVPIYIPCGALEAYQATKWSNYNIQYQPYHFKFSVISAEPHKGSVISQEGNSCETSSLSAVPNEGFYFVQWSDGNSGNPRSITVTQDTTIAAIFGPFIISFVDDNDTILSSQEYDYGAIPIPPVDPVKTNDTQYSYGFAGWSPQIVSVTSDATYKATYTSTLNKYTITFMSEDSVLSADLWEYGATPIYSGATPTKADDGEYMYTFEDWTPEIVSVTADATYTATFTATPKIEAIDNVMNHSLAPLKYIRNGHLLITMPDGKKYSIIGERVE